MPRSNASRSVLRCDALLSLWIIALVGSVSLWIGLFVVNPTTPSRKSGAAGKLVFVAALFRGRVRFTFLGGIRLDFIQLICRLTEYDGNVLPREPSRPHLFNAIYD